MTTQEYTRRRSIKLSAKGLAALMATAPFLAACGEASGSRTELELEPIQDSGLPGFTPDAGVAEEAVDAGIGMDESVRGMDMDTSESMEGAVSGAIDWEGFLDAVAELAQLQYTTGWDQESYVEDVAQLMLNLDLSDPVIVEAYAHYADEVRGFPEITEIYEEPGFELATLEFEAGEAIDLHDHPGMTGVILCVSGQVEIENFDLLEEPSIDGNLLLVRSGSVVLTAGMSATLTSERGNIHALRATRFTQLLDVFTPPYNDDRIARSRWYRRSAEHYLGRDEVFEAWES